MYKIIGADGKEYGPISAEQLRQWIAEGRANGQTRVLLEGTADWKTLAEIPEFAAILSAPAPNTSTLCSLSTLAPYLREKVVEKPLGIRWTRHGLWMKLYRVKGILDMLEALIAAIVGVDEPGREIRRQRSHCEPVILRGNVAAFCPMQHAGLILAAVPKFQFIRIPARRQRQQLMSQADAKDGNAAF